MADFKIKSAVGTGNKTLLQSQDQTGSNYAIQVGDAGATTLTNATLTTATMSAGTIGSSVVVPGSVGASLVHLNTTTISSAVGDVQFDNTLITTTYNYYKVVMQAVSCSADNFDFSAVVSNDNGSSGVAWHSQAHSYRLNGSTSGGWDNFSNVHFLWADAEGVDAASGGFGVFELIIAPTVAPLDGCTRSWTAVKNQNGDFYGYSTTGIPTTSSSSARINHIKFDENNGSNLDSGKFSLYGCKL